MEFKDLIAARRSVRSYQSGATRKDLEAICKAAQQAPSWMNQQTARCYVLETPEVLESLRDAALPSFNRNSSANAALIVTTFVKGIVGFGPDGQPVDDIGNGWGIYDLGLHDAYLILAGLSGKGFTWAAFLAGAFTNAVPGIILQIVLIPVLVMVLERAGLSLNKQKE